MARMTECQACRKAFEINQESLEPILPLRIAFRGSIIAAKCRHCGHVMEATHSGEQQTWDAIFFGEIA